LHLNTNYFPSIPAAHLCIKVHQLKLSKLSKSSNVAVKNTNFTLSLEATDEYVSVAGGSDRFLQPTNLGHLEKFILI
jgi:hypothetical protein